MYDSKHPPLGPRSPRPPTSGRRSRPNPASSPSRGGRRRSRTTERASRFPRLNPTRTLLAPGTRRSRYARTARPALLRSAAGAQAGLSGSHGDGHYPDGVGDGHQSEVRDSESARSPATSRSIHRAPPNTGADSISVDGGAIRIDILALGDAWRCKCGEARDQNCCGQQSGDCGFHTNIPLLVVTYPDCYRCANSGTLRL